MLTYTYISKGKFGLMEKPKPAIRHERDAIVKVTLASILVQLADTLATIAAQRSFCDEVTKADNE